MIKSIQFQDNPVYYHVYGEGQPVVLIHGFGEDGRIWNHQVDALKNSYQIIIPDLPGSGKSLLGNFGCSMESMADCIYEILLAEFSDSSLAGISPKQQLASKLAKKEKAILLGHSMGGYITLAIAEKYPDMVRAFGLIHSTAYADNDEKKVIRRKGISFIKEFGAAEFIQQSIPNLFSQNFKQENPQIVKELADRYTNFSPGVLVHYYEAMMERPDRTAVLKEFKGPVLFIMGTHDAAIPLEHSLQQCHLPGISFIRILENSGHMGILEETTKTNEYLEKFISEIEIVMPATTL